MELELVEKLPGAYNVFPAASGSVVALSGSSLVVYDAAKRKTLAALKPKQDLRIDNVASASWSPGGKLIGVGSVAGQIAILDTKRWKVVEHLGKVASRDRAPHFISDTHYFYQRDASVVLREIGSDDEKILGSVSPNGHFVGALRLSDSERRRWYTTVVTPTPVDDESPLVELVMVRVTPKSVKVSAPLVELDAREQLQALHPRAAEIITSVGQTSYVRSTKSGEVRESADTTSTSSWLSAAWSPDGKLIAFGDHADVDLCSAKNLDGLAQVPVKDVTHIAFTACGKYLVAAAGSGGKMSRVFQLG